MTLGFAVVAALVYLAWLLERDAAARAGARALARLRLGALALGARRGRRRARRGRRELADWVHLSAASLWVGGLVALVGRRLARRAGAAAARRSCASRASRSCSSRSCSRPGSTSRSCGCRSCRDLWTQRYGRGAAREARARRGACSPGARSTTSSCGRGSPARATASSPASAGASPARAPSAIAVLLAAAVLVDSKPPPRPASAPVTQAVARR